MASLAAPTTPHTFVRVAIEGCCHGELDAIYAAVEEANAVEEERARSANTAPRNIELLLCCGDFQAVRNQTDLDCMACPVKYRQMNTFYKYYSGEKVAPVLTICIGGNHEASNHMQELPYGGWVAPNIYFLGYAGIITYKGLRIGGLSGIYNQHDYTKVHYETFPYTPSSMRSCYHVRQTDVYALSLLSAAQRDGSTPAIDIFLSHDWPRGIALFGDTAGLLQKKRFLKDEILSNQFGSIAGEALMYDLKPKYWFSAHMHVKFAAVVRHPDPATHSASSSPPAPTTTKFLALDKCLPRRQFLQVFDFDISADRTGAPAYTDDIRYDSAWLGVLKGMHVVSASGAVPAREKAEQLAHDGAAWVHEKLSHYEHAVDGLRPPRFARVAPAYPSRHHGRLGSPQTDELLNILELEHLLSIPAVPPPLSQQPPLSSTVDVVEDENEIDIEF
jgi:lariat debranching enzyme